MPMTVGGCKDGCPHISGRNRVIYRYTGMNMTPVTLEEAIVSLMIEMAGHRRLLTTLDELICDACDEDKNHRCTRGMLLEETRQTYDMAAEAVMYFSHLIHSHCDELTTSIEISYC